MFRSYYSTIIWYRLTICVFLLMLYLACSFADNVVLDNNDNVASTQHRHSETATGDSHSDVPIGHMKPLGSHRPPEGTVDSVDGFLDPKTFFDKYVKASKPILFKGAAKGIPAYALWEDSYLDEKFGNVTVDVETGKKENRSNSLVQFELYKFLHIYTKSDIYMVQDVNDDMKADLSMLKPLMCGGFQKLLQNAVMWFSSGGTKSVLHSDSLYNINCMFDGDKTLIMIDRKYKSLVEAEEFVHDGAFSPVDVEAVDMKRFPSLGKVPWWYAKMEKGDCFYIPYLWYHTVASSPSRNLAVNLWFLRPPVFHYEDCERADDDMLPDHSPLSSYQFNDEEFSWETKLKSDMYDQFDGADLTIDHLKEVWVGIFTDKELEKIFADLDLDGDKVVTWQEMDSVDLNAVINKYPNVLAASMEAEERDEL